MCNTSLRDKPTFAFFVSSVTHSFDAVFLQKKGTISKNDSMGNNLSLV